MKNILLSIFFASNLFAAYVQPPYPSTLGGTGTTSIANITAELNLFTNSLQGLVPGSGGGSSNFLRADGTWASPAGGITGSGILGEVTVWNGMSALTGYTGFLSDSAGNVTVNNLIDSSLSASQFVQTNGSAELVSASASTVTSQLNLFTSSLQGLAPSSGGGTTNFLRADGTWDAPVGTSYLFADSLVNTSGTVTLVNDSATPGNSKYYGTNGGGTLGYFALPTGSISGTGVSGQVTVWNGTTAITGYTGFLSDSSGNVTVNNLTDSSLSASQFVETNGSAGLVSASASTVTSQLNLFTTSLQGLTPSSGGGTTNFLRADGTWTAPSSSVSFPLLAPNGTAAAPSYAFSSSTSTGVFSSGTNDIDFSSNGVDRWEIPASFTFKGIDILSGTSTAGNDATISGSSQTVASATAKGGNLTIQAGSANGANSTGVGGSLFLDAGTSVGGNGGAVTIASGSPQSNSVAGGTGGNITISAANANGNNTQNNSGGSVSMTAGTSFGSAGGGTVTISSGVGGPGTSTAGASGGTTNVTGGNGGIGSVTSGSGGGATLKAGTGGAGVGGGGGGTAQVTGGTAGAGSSTGGNGGPVQITGGSAAAVAGSAGGAITISSAGGTSTGSGGVGGSITISTGAAGGDNSVNNTGGSLTMSVGASKGSSNGATASITAGTGGLGTGATGANGGNASFTAGNGGIGSATGGTGGNVTITGGSGGNSGAPGVGGDVNIQAAATTSPTTYLTISHTAAVQVKSSQLSVTSTGFGLSIAHGTNCKLGTTALVGGTATVSDTAVTANSIIFLTSQSDGGTPGFVRVTAKSAGSSFTITSSNAGDTSTIGWMIVEGI